MNARIYDPVVGRFMTADDIVQDPFDLQSWNAYSYVFNNPLSFTDPSGHVIETVVVTAPMYSNPATAIIAVAIDIASVILGADLFGAAATPPPVAVTVSPPNLAQSANGGGNPSSNPQTANTAADAQHEAETLRQTEGGAKFSTDDVEVTAKKIVAATTPPQAINGSTLKLAAATVGGTVAGESAIANAERPPCGNGVTSGCWRDRPVTSGLDANGEPVISSQPSVWVPYTGNGSQLAQEIVPPIVEDPLLTPEGMAPFEDLPSGSSKGPGAGKSFPKNVGKPGPGEDPPNCQYCKKPTTKEPGPDQYNRDHIIPKSQGGDNTEDNLAPSCRTCNLKKGPRTPFQWYQSMQAWLDLYEQRIRKNIFRVKPG